jgi:integrase
MAPRRRTKDRDLPPRVYKHGRQYRFVPVDPATGKNAKPIALGADKAAALRKWAEIVGEQAPSTQTVAGLWERYAREELPRKAAATQQSARQQSKRILAVFGAMHLAALEPHHAIQYLDRRGQQSPTQANREIALLRHLLTKATHWGLIPRNPLLGLQYRNPEKPRERYVTDDELATAIERAPAWIGALMWLAYLTGLRRGDLLRLTRFQLKDDGIEVRESKTGKRVMIEWTPELRRIVNQALDASPDDRLFPITASAVNNAWGRFQRALAADGGERFYLRDLRAKHATDFDAAGGDATAQLGHSGRAITARHYLRQPRRVVPIR